ncbi:GPP34 family phosphoprotein [Streptomyces sp. NBC_00306]|uniref:GPP34 family phosphoprotein n=1 Tax=Streptomyces sp. NBC_00306 TaxID=2975708 RepID=UPI002E2B5AA1|nr:GPP34 family phosphoprotein [Streptomyces sp. NBC_00306]
MTTPKNLLMITIEVAPGHPVHPADLSLSLAGAQLVDLLEAGAIGLDKRHVVPGWQPVPPDRFLWEAATSLELTRPYQLVSDWLSSREDTLAAAYTAALEADGLAIRQRPRKHPFRRRELVLVDSPARREAVERWSASEPVLATLAGFIGIRREGQQGSPREVRGPVATILSAVQGAHVELEAERTERIITQAKLYEVWARYGD